MPEPQTPPPNTIQPIPHKELTVIPGDPNMPVVKAPTIDSIRAAVKTQLDDADTDLAKLRSDRDALNLRIRDAVQARDEIAKIYSQLQPKTPRTRKPKTQAGEK